MRSELLLLHAKSGPSSAFGTFSPLAGRRGSRAPWFQGEQEEWLYPSPRLRGEGARRAGEGERAQRAAFAPCEKRPLIRLRHLLPACGEKEKEKPLPACGEKEAIPLYPLPACGERMPGGQVRGASAASCFCSMRKAAPHPPSAPSPRSRGEGERRTPPRVRGEGEATIPARGESGSRKLNQRFTGFTVPPRAIGYSIGSVTTSPTRRAA